VAHGGRAETDERHLAQRHHAAVAGQQDEREQDQREGEAVGPDPQVGAGQLRGDQQRRDEQCRPGDERRLQRCDARRDRAGEGRGPQPILGQRDQRDEEDEHRQHVVDAGEEAAASAGELDDVALPEPDADRADDRDRQVAQAPDDRRRVAVDDEQRQQDDVELQDRGDEDPGQPGE
jgi:hypothetical protein